MRGPGGTGKTRLALEAGARLVTAFEDGVWFVDLSALTDPRLVALEIWRSLGLGGTPGPDAVASLAARLADHSCLIILDNCEHVLEASADVAAAIGGACGSVRILATTREPLGVAGEVVWDVQPLDEAASVELFVERAGRARRGFALTADNADAVARICRRLDGLPLAIELAAAAIAAFGPQDIADRLDRRLDALAATDPRTPARRRTLRGAIDWSYDLLDPGHRTVFARLGVFTGAFSPDAARAVCAADDVTALVRASLLRVDEVRGRARYSMLDTIRTYAAERAASEMDALRARHLAWYADLARRTGAELEAEQLDLLASEAANLRAAVSFALERSDPDAATIVVSLRRLWEARGDAGEVLRWVRTILEWAHVGPQDRSRVLSAGAKFAVDAGDLASARRWASERVDAARAGGVPAALVGALHDLGMVARTEANYGEARALLSEGCDVARRSGDERTMAQLLRDLAVVDVQEGDLAAARGRLEEAVAVCRQEGMDVALSTALDILAGVDAAEGDAAAASARLEESLSIRRALHHRPGIMSSLVNLGVNELGPDPALAKERFVEALGIARELHAAPAEATCVHNLGAACTMTGELAEAERWYREALTLRRRLGNTGAGAETQAGLGGLLCAMGRYDRARPVLDESLATARRIGNARIASYALIQLAALHLASGDPDAAERHLDEAGHPAFSVERDLALAEVALHRGDPERAQELASPALERSADGRGRADALDVLARAAAAPDEALRLHRRSLELYREIGYLPGTAQAMEGVAGVLAERGEGEEAARLLGAAEAIRERCSAEAPGVRAGTERAAVAAAGRAAVERAWSEGRAMSVDRAVALATAGEAAVRGWTFRREGDWWTVSDPARAIRVKDSKGMRYLSHLLAIPGREVHVLDLVAAVEGTSAVTDSDAGAVLDPEARETYRRRALELREAIEEAESFEDTARAARAQEELDAIAAQLRSGSGLRGGDRRVGSAAERGRSAAGKAIRAAVPRIADEHPSVGAHLRTAVRTGVFCS